MENAKRDQQQVGKNCSDKAGWTYFNIPVLYKNIILRLKLKKSYKMSYEIWHSMV